MAHDDIIITAATKRQKEEELIYFRTVKRPDITEQIRKAREYGDLKENFEYQAARQAQAILNGRIAEIQALLEKATVIEDTPHSGDTVQMGCSVTVKDLETDDEWDYIIVDATSADPINDKISYSSPIGEALLGHKVGEVIEIKIPAGKTKYEIVSLKFE